MQLTEERATVSYIEGEHAFLETEGSSACGSCSSQSSCGSVRLIKRPSSYLKIQNTLNLEAGDLVVLGLAPEKLLFSTILVYLLPLFSLFFFALIGKTLGGELLSIIAGVAGLLLSLVFIKKFLGRSDVARSFEPQLIRVVNK